MRTLIAALLALVLAPAAVSAQAGSISGRVAKAPKQTGGRGFPVPSPPIPDVGVHAFDSGGGHVSSTTSDSDGLYTLSGLTPGTYYVRTAVPAGAPFLDQLYDGLPCDSCNVTFGSPIAVSAGAATSAIDFYLKPIPPIVTTTAASNVTTTGATLSGVVNPNGTNTQAQFELGTTTAYGTTITVSPGPGSGTAAVQVAATISSLVCNTRYHFRVAALNYQPLWQYGSDLTFDTVQCPPTVDPVANVFTPMNSQIVVPLNVESTAGANGVTLSAVASNPELISALIFSGSGSSRTLVISPAMDRRGVATITITATDGTGTSTRSFGLRVDAAIRGDLNGDMTSDIVWRHSSGTVAIWLMNGTQVIGGGELTIIDPEWQIAGVGDFNADNHADLIWRYTNSTGFIWLFGPVSGGTAVIEGGPLQNFALYASASWIGDFDGDGHDDLVLHGPGLSITFMDGFRYSHSGSPGVDTGWRIQGVADYNADGRADILWRKDAGDVAMWTMDGTQQSAVDFLGAVDPEWHVAGSADYNGDLKADILWRHTSGDVVIWFMDGGHVIGGGPVASVDPAWQIVGTGDYNGDGRADILWRHTSGGVTIWLMNGLQIIGGGQIAIVDPAWQVVNTR